MLDAHTAECLHYEPIVGVPPTKHVRIPREILAEHPEVEIRNDLIDCHIDVTIRVHDLQSQLCAKY